MSVIRFPDRFYDCTECGARVWVFVPGAPKPQDLVEIARKAGVDRPESVCFDCILQAVLGTADA